MNRLRVEKRTQVLKCLVDCVSVRGTVRITDVSKPTVLRVLEDVGAACQRYHDERVYGLTSRRVQVDEIWSFVHAKAKNVPADKRGVFGYGDVWTWTAIDADSKLIIAWYVGRRDAGAAHIFMNDVASRIANRIQLTSDGNQVYLGAVDEAFNRQVDYAMLVKQYGESPEAEKRYSPAICVGAQKEPVRGRPDPAHISTSYVEKNNQTLRASNKRFARLTAAHSKKLANHKHSLALHFMYYNYARTCETIRCTPAMQAGLTDHVWEIEELGALADQL